MMKMVRRCCLPLACMAAVCLAGFALPIAGAQTGTAEENVAAGKPVAFYGRDGLPVEPVWMDPSRNDNPETFEEALTDGIVSPWFGTVQIDGLGWAQLDLGGEYALTGVATSFWHDWGFREVVIQSATDADFTQNVRTLYSNDVDNVLGQGAGAPLTYGDQTEALQENRFSPVTGRYVRVTNRDNRNGNLSLFSELKVYAATESALTATANRAAEYQPEEFALELLAEGGADIHYTTDGSIPTLESTKYAAPIPIAKGQKVLVRASVKKADGKLALPNDFRYTVGAGDNVALGNENIIFYDYSGTPMTPVWFSEHSSNPAKFETAVTDGVVDQWFGTVKLEGGGWAQLDLGAVYPITEIRTSFWGNWDFSPVVIQVSTDANFEQNVLTVYNSDTENKFGQGAGTDTYVQDVPNETKGYPCQVTGRYVRVTNDHWAQGFSLFSELQADVSSEYPIRQLLLVSASGFEDFTVPNNLPISDLLADRTKFPETLSVTDSDGKDITLTGSWSSTDYDGGTAGVYEFVFAPENLPANVSDGNGVLKLHVTVSEAPDRAALAAKIAEASALSEADYTSSSWEDFETALNAANGINTSPAYQSEVDEALSRLEEGMAALVRRGDKTGLDASVRKAEELLSSDYTTPSFEALSEALLHAKEVQNNTDAVQSVVDRALSDLETAVSELVPRGDKTALRKDCEDFAALVSAEYTTASWTIFSAVLADANALLARADGEVSAREVEAAELRLKEAFGSLVVRANFSEIEAAVNAEEDRDLSGLTPATRADYEAALALAGRVLADDSTVQADIDSALKSLREAVANLKVAGDKSLLGQRVAVREESEDYTASSYAAYLEAFEKASRVNADPEATQKDVDEALALFDQKRAALTAIADKADLKALIEEAEQLDTTGYRAESIKNFDEALVYAKSVQASNDVSQEQADGAAAALRSAIDGLRPEKSALLPIVLCSVGGALALAAVILLILFKRKRSRGEI